MIMTANINNNGNYYIPCSTCFCSIFINTFMIVIITIIFIIMIVIKTIIMFLKILIISCWQLRVPFLSFPLLSSFSLLLHYHKHFYHQHYYQNISIGGFTQGAFPGGGGGALIF